LPLAQEPLDVLQQALTAELGKPLNILAIDDMEPVLLMLRDGLSEFGQKVWTALSGRQGLEIFKQHKIDLVICDLGMPGMTGWQVGKAIKQICEEEGVPKTPFILLTGWGGQYEEESKISDAGVDRIVEKPIDLPTLIKNIRILAAADRFEGPPA
jgi:CheY-like chemotaxis protein